MGKSFVGPSLTRSSLSEKSAGAVAHYLCGADGTVGGGAEGSCYLGLARSASTEVAILWGQSRPGRWVW